MKSAAFLLACTLVLSACGLRREKPPETVPNAVRPDGTPVVTEPERPSFQKIDPEEEKKLRADTARSPGHVVAMLDVHFPSVQSTDGTTSLPSERRTMFSAEGTYQPLEGNGVGVTARIIAGGPSSPQYTEIGFLVGSRQLALDLGGATRRGYGRLSGGNIDSTYAMARLGVRSRVNLGDSQFSLLTRVNRYLSFPEPGGADFRAVPNGWSGEAGLSWTWPGRIPFTANLGYRWERFRVWNRDQDVSGLSLGGGLLLGRRPGL